MMNILRGFVCPHFYFLFIPRFISSLPLIPLSTTTPTQAIDVEFLRKVTNTNVPSELANMFWEAMGSYSHHERALVLKFICGRTTLPLRPTNDDMIKIQLGSTNGPPDEFLPVSHTCYWTLDLPRYSCLQVLRKKLLYAAVHCKAIDLDFNTGENEGWVADVSDEE